MSDDQPQSLRQSRLAAAAARLLRRTGPALETETEAALRYVDVRNFYRNTDMWIAYRGTPSTLPPCTGFMWEWLSIIASSQARQPTSAQENEFIDNIRRVDDLLRKHRFHLMGMNLDHFIGAVDQLCPSLIGHIPKTMIKIAVDQSLHGRFRQDTIACLAVVAKHHSFEEIVIEPEQIKYIALGVSLNITQHEMANHIDLGQMSPDEKKNIINNLRVIIGLQFYANEYSDDTLYTSAAKLGEHLISNLYLANAMPDDNEYYSCVRDYDADITGLCLEHLVLRSRDDSSFYTVVAPRVWHSVFCCANLDEARQHFQQFYEDGDTSLEKGLLAFARQTLLIEAGIGGISEVMNPDQRDLSVAFGVAMDTINAEVPELFARVSNAFHEMIIPSERNETTAPVVTEKPAPGR